MNTNTKEAYSLGESIDISPLAGGPVNWDIWEIWKAAEVCNVLSEWALGMFPLRFGLCDERLVARLKHTICLLTHLEHGT